MTFSFRPARMEQAGLFIAIAGGTNSGKTYSALRLGRGIAGPNGKLAAIDTEAKRMSHYAADFAFDVVDLEPPFRPERFAMAAAEAEEAGYAALIIDSFSMEWVGPGGVLDWQEKEFARLGSKEANRLQSWVKPKTAHKAMVYSFLQRRIPIIFALRAEEKVEKSGSDVVKVWQPVCNKQFPFELTVSFMLQADSKGIINLEAPSVKLEKAHRAFFHHGDIISEEHGAKLAEWARGAALSEPAKPAAKKRTWADVLEDLRQLAGAAETEAEVEELRGHDLVVLVMDKGAENVRKQAETILRDAAERFGPGLDEEAAA